MMNKDDERYESSIAGRGRSTEMLDAADDQKPAAKVVVAKAGASNQLLVAKRKRKSPDKPWKKPPDMPKRPLSAYNIFFRDERERLLGTGSDTKPENETAGSAGKVGGKKVKSKSGIGFSNLAKTIANRWNELDKEIRAPYEEIAAAEKKKYDELVAEWRIKQAAKKKALALAKKEAGEELKVALRTVPNTYPSDRSLGSFSDTSNPYPSEWFHSGPDHDGTRREDTSTSTSRTAVPPIVETMPGMTYENRMHGASSSTYGWQQGRQDHSSYYQYGGGPYESTGSQMRYSPETERPVYTYPMDESIRASAPHDYSPIYRDYYHHSQHQSMYPHQTSGSRRRTDMRMSRAASLPASRHDEMASGSPSSPEEIEYILQQEIERSSASLRPSRARLFRPQHNPATASRGATAYPRSSSMPYVQHAPTHIGSRRHRIHQVDFEDPMGPPTPRFDEMQDEAYRSMQSYGRQQMMQASSMSRRHVQQHLHPDSDVMESEASLAPLVGTMRTATTAAMLPQGQQSAAQPISETAIAQTSLQSLNDTLDEDAISFITAMKYP
jgi:HMG (high mobility group) box